MRSSGRHFAVLNRCMECCEEFRIANVLDKRDATMNSAGKEALHALVGPAHPAIRTDGNYRLLHTVKQGDQFPWRALDFVETILQAARGSIEGTGHLANFVIGDRGDSRRQVSLGDAL